MIKTLLVDGNNLLKIGFHGVKDFYHNGKHIGGIWHFLNTIRRFIEEQNFDKVVVFWDGEDNSLSRKLLYPRYKENRTKEINEYKETSFQSQQERVKQYLEEMFIRQINITNNEADDLIAYYCQISHNEFKTIFSSDKDLTQLISDKVSVYSPSAKQTYKNGDKIKIYDYSIPHENVKTYKILSVDKSDNIDGIELLGEKTLVKLFPDMLVKPCTMDEIRVNAGNIVQEKKSKVLENILIGKTKNGILGEQFYQTNKKIVDLHNPLITDDGKELVEQIQTDTIDPTDRGYKNLMRMMMDDGLFKYLPKNDEAWVNFLKPFMKLTRKEKRNTNKN